MKPVEILILTRSLALDQGLGALLESLPEVVRVQTARDLSSGLGRIESSKPGVVLIDASLITHDRGEILNKIRSLSPQTRRVLLVDDAEAVKWVPQYAEGILVKGALPATVVDLITNLLSRKGEEHEHDD